MLTNGIYPNTNRDNMENYIDDDDYIRLVKQELESRSDRKFDLESILYMIEEWRLSKHSTIYEMAVKTGLINRLAL